MRDVRSEPLYIQMKGRGTRGIGDDVLASVTQDAFSAGLLLSGGCLSALLNLERQFRLGEDEGPTETITLKLLEHYDAQRTS